MAALTSSAGPFFAKDSNGTMQKIKVIDLPNDPSVDTDDLIAGYAYVEATGSTFEVISDSYDRLTDISSALQPLSILEQAINQITESVDNNTKYVEQLLMFNRATNVYTKIYKKEDLFNHDGILTSSISRWLHQDTDLNPFYGSEEGEDYMSKAVDVVIQNSTNKNLYLKVDYNPGTEVSETNYTVKLLPGIIYNSESKIAHIRHKIIFANDASASFVGEVPVSIIYNTGLNNDLSIGETTPGENLLSSITTNYWDMDFIPNVPYVVAEWYFDDNTFENMRIRGQARVADVSLFQEIELYVTSDPNKNIMLENKSQHIVDETPTVFDLTFAGPIPSGRYELIAKLTGNGVKGDARVLFADLIRYAKP